MSDSDKQPSQTDNRLYRIAAAGSVVVGALLLAGAYGHFAAIWDRLDDPAYSRFALLLPGVLLLLSGIINIALCVPLWHSTLWAQRLALASNVIAATYFAYLLSDAVPNHPIGLFVATATGHVLVLASISVGLRWPISRQ